ncbi:CASP-like protein 1C1 [Mercurialis annua]|uniref:CASP-like protein 1C1 n=1 Tax=Mercurialis annua TaxID=3986 RepID=UPI00215EB435|nr:CASP-like protein 1C1 [Mercurialis annua]
MAKIKRICTLLLRLIAFSSTLAAAIVMATSHESGSFFTISYEAKYTDTPAFKYFVAVNSIVSIYGFVILFLPSENKLWQLVVATDVVFTMLVSSSISAALAVAQVGKKGNSHAGWLPICGQVPKYCDQITGSLAAAFIALITYAILLLYSIHTILHPLQLQKT